jgi:ComF family protein
MNSSWLTSLYARGASRTRVGSAVQSSHWISNWRTAFDRWLGAAIGLLAPPSCAACGREEEPFGGLRSVMPHLCHTCQDAISPANANRCLRCGAPVGPFLDARRDCIYCRGDRFHFETVIRLGIYRAELRSMCLAAKRPRSEELSAALAAFLWQREESLLRGTRAQLIVPIPHHWTENLRRTPHAPETLATVLSRCLRVKMATHILAKTRRTEKQSELPQSRRRTNLKGAFHVPRRFHSDLEGRRILLVDDVLTTGATANEAAQSLLAANAHSVTVTVIARALGKKFVSGPPG